MKLLLLLVCLVVIASCAKPSGDEFKRKLQSAASKYCSNPNSMNRFKLQNYLNAYETMLGSKRSEVVSLTKSILDGSAKCEASQRKKAVATDSVSVSCDSTPIDVEYGAVNIDCSLSIELDEGIYYYDVYAYIETSNGDELEAEPSSGSYYFYDSSASTTTQSGDFTLLFPQYAPSGTWTVELYAYGPSFDTYYYGTTSAYVEATVNDEGPPVLTGLSIPYVDTVSSSSAEISFSATDDLSGVEEFYTYFYDSTYTNYLGYGYWESSSSGVLSVSNDAYVYLNNVPFGTYNVFVELYDFVGFYSYYQPSDLENLGFAGTIINAGNNCTAGKYLPAGATGACLTCAAGTFSVYGSIACQVCPPGSHGNGKGASSCVECLSGYFSNGGTSACTLCPAGKYSSSTGTSVCTPCSPGTYTSVTGSTSCSYCGAGTYSCGGATACKSCAAGTYTSYEDASFCYQCSAGTYSAAGASSCTPCPAGTYAAAVGATTCTSCASGKTSPAGSNSPLDPLKSLYRPVLKFSLVITSHYMQTCESSNGELSHFVS